MSVVRTVMIDDAQRVPGGFNILCRQASGEFWAWLPAEAADDLLNHILHNGFSTEPITLTMEERGIHPNSPLALVEITGEIE